MGWGGVTLGDPTGAVRRKARLLRGFAADPLVFEICSRAKSPMCKMEQGDLQSNPALHHYQLGSTWPRKML